MKFKIATTMIMPWVMSHKSINICMENVTIIISTNKVYGGISPNLMTANTLGYMVRMFYIDI